MVWYVVGMYQTKDSLSVMIDLSRLRSKTVFHDDAHKNEEDMVREEDWQDFTGHPLLVWKVE